MGMMGAGELPYSEAILYGLTHGYRGPDLLEFWEDIHAIDRVYCSVESEAIKAKTSNKAAPSANATIPKFVRPSPGMSAAKTPQVRLRSPKSNLKK